MKSRKNLLNDLARESTVLRTLTDEETHELQKVLVEMYIDFSEICDKNNLTYMLSSGSCLGAVRHSGFIPWDDDLDIMMPRKDYEKLKVLCEVGELGCQYEFSYPNNSVESKTTFMKIFKKNTINREIGECIDSPFPIGVYIDIFILDTIPTNKVYRSIKSLVANGLRFISSAVNSSRSSSSEYDSFIKGSKSLKRLSLIYKLIGHIFSLIPRRKWVYWFDAFVSSSKPDKPIGMPAGRHLYSGEVYDQSILYPPTKILFEDIEVFVPAKYDDYLCKLYGNNYMQIPPVEKRERHFIVDFKL